MKYKVVAIDMPSVDQLEDVLRPLNFLLIWFKFASDSKLLQQTIFVLFKVPSFVKYFWTTKCSEVDMDPNVIWLLVRTTTLNLN